MVTPLSIFGLPAGSLSFPLSLERPGDNNVSPQKTFFSRLGFRVWLPAAQKIRQLPALLVRLGFLP